MVRAEAVRLVGLVLSTNTFRVRKEISTAPFGIIRAVARRATTVTRYEHASRAVYPPVVLLC